MYCRNEFVCLGRGWGGEISPNFKNSEDGIRVSSTSHHHFNKGAGTMPSAPSLPPHTTFQSSTYNTSVQYMQHSTSPVIHHTSSVQHTIPVHIIHQSSTCITPPVQYIQHIIPVHLYRHHTHARVRMNVGLLQCCDGLSPARPHSGL